MRHILLLELIAFVRVKGVNPVTYRPSRYVAVYFTFKCSQISISCCISHSYFLQLHYIKKTQRQRLE